jgi:hypothetical protein
MADEERRARLIEGGRFVVNRAQTEPDFAYIEAKFNDVVLHLRINPGDVMTVFCALRPSLPPLLGMLQAAGFATETIHPNNECSRDAEACKCRRPVTIRVSIPMDGCA